MVILPFKKWPSFILINKQMLCCEMRNAHNIHLGRIKKPIQINSTIYTEREILKVLSSSKTSLRRLFSLAGPAAISPLFSALSIWPGCVLAEVQQRAAHSISINIYTIRPAPPWLISSDSAAQHFASAAGQKQPRNAHIQQTQTAPEDFPSQGWPKRPKSREGVGSGRLVFSTEKAAWGLKHHQGGSGPLHQRTRTNYLAFFCHLSLFPALREREPGRAARSLLQLPPITRQVAATFCAHLCVRPYSFCDKQRDIVLFSVADGAFCWVCVCVRALITRRQLRLITRGFFSPGSAGCYFLSCGAL